MATITKKPLSDIPKARRKRLLKYAQVQMEKEDILKEARREWGTIVHLITSLAECREWKCDTDCDIDLAALKLSKEWEDREIRLLFISADDLRLDYFKGVKELDYMKRQLSDAKLLVKKLKNRMITG